MHAQSKFIGRSSQQLVNHYVMELQTSTSERSTRIHV